VEAELLDEHGSWTKNGGPGTTDADY
jgi:hypothetical protein